MKYQIACLLCCWLLPAALPAQPDWTKIVPEAFEALDREAADSLHAYRERSDTLRARMERLTVSKGLSRTTVFGVMDTWAKEGMSGNFNRPPRDLMTKVPRDTDIVRLEKLHAALYWQDKGVLRWRDIEKRLQSHPDRAQFRRWSLLLREVPPPMARDLSNRPELCRQWVRTEVVCDIVAAIDLTSPDRAGSKVRKFDLKFDTPRLDTLEAKNPPRVWQFPVPPEVILFSFPVNGQYNFRRDESIPGVGYAVLPLSAGAALGPIIYSQTAWYARWCSARGRVTYTAMEVRNNHEFFFNLPDNYFRDDELYRLELVAMPKGSVAPLLPEDICWQAFRGQDHSPMPTQVRLPDEVKITELYFRTGKYDIYEQLDELKGEVDWERGIVSLETDEPLDALEINGNGNFPPIVTFNLLSTNFFKYVEALDSKELYYYLTVPTVEPLDALPPNQLAVAEQDNTFGAAFIEDVRKGAPGSYPQLPEHQQQAVELSGGYVAPALSRAFARDTFISERPVPFITRSMFENNRMPAVGKVRCQLIVGEFQQIVQAARLHRQQIERRIGERSQFLYELERRAALRAGQPVATTLEACKAREIANLPPAVKLLYETQFPEAIQNNFTLLYSRVFPGSKQRSCELMIPLTEKK